MSRASRHQRPARRGPLVAVALALAALVGTTVLVATRDDGRTAKAAQAVTIQRAHAGQATPTL